MSLDTLKNMIPDYAKDLKLNLGSLANEDDLNTQQKWGTFLACALAGRNDTVIAMINAEAEDNLSAEALSGAKSAAAIMAMNNIYYRFAHIATSKDYMTMPAKLRMNVIGNPGVDKIDFELWSLAVSAINGCGMCIDAHEKQLLDHDISKAQIQTAVRIAATVQAVSAILDGENAMNMDMQTLSQAA
jgi:alkyl hydroperoxide reductase subunit D